MVVAADGHRRDDWCLGLVFLVGVDAWHDKQQDGGVNGQGGEQENGASIAADRCQDDGHQEHCEQHQQPPPCVLRRCDIGKLRAAVVVADGLDLPIDLYSVRHFDRFESFPGDGDGAGPLVAHQRHRQAHAESHRHWQRGCSQLRSIDLQSRNVRGNLQVTLAGRVECNLQHGADLDGSWVFCNLRVGKRRNDTGCGDRHVEGDTPFQVSQ